MELLLLSVAIVGTSAGSILIAHAIVRLVRSRTVAVITPIPLCGGYIQPGEAKSEPLSLLHCSFISASPTQSLYER